MTKSASRTGPQPEQVVSSAFPARSRLDTIIELVSLAARALPLSVFLDRAPALLAQVFQAPVASLYLLDADGETIVLRGNVGFGKTALGRIRMRVGEGLTGLAIADRRPLSVTHGPSHDLFLGFPELNEDRYPIFAVAPLIGPDGPVGGLVIQRGKKPFCAADVDLLMALSAAIYAALRSAALVDGLAPAPVKQENTQARRVLLTGRPIHPGRALGTLTLIRRPSKKNQAHPRSNARQQAQAPQLLQKAFTMARRILEPLRDKVGPEAQHPTPWSSYLDFLSDARLRGRAFELAEHGATISRALNQVAREAARAAVQLSQDTFLQNRARELEDLCDALVMLAQDRPEARPPRKSILMADSFTIYELLVSFRSQPVAVVLTEKANPPPALGLVTLLEVPALMEVKGLFRWAAEGDIALLDAHHGYLHINPSHLEVSEFKAWRKKRHESRAD